MAEALKPIQITLYDPETDEVKGTYSRSYVPWKILKRAIRLQNSLDMESLSEEDLDQLTMLVVDVFGDKFTADDLEEGADIGEMMAVLVAVISRAGSVMKTSGIQGIKNPPKAAGKK